MPSSRHKGSCIRPAGAAIAGCRAGLGKEKGYAGGHSSDNNESGGKGEIPLPPDCFV